MDEKEKELPPWPGPGWSLATDEDGTERWVESWPDSPASEPVEEGS
jgi:hypothetical protein